MLAVPLGNVEEALEVITTDGKGKLLQGIRVGDCANRFADNAEVANIGQVFRVLDRSKFQVIEYIQEKFLSASIRVSETG